MQAAQLELGRDSLAQTQAEVIQSLVAEMTELEYALIPHGLHVAGRGMQRDERLDMLEHVGAGMPAVVSHADRQALVLAIADGDDLAVAQAEKAGSPDLKESIARLKAMNSELVTNRELDGLVLALDARYVPPSPSGDLLRTPELLPTGRNIHGFDPFGIPSAFAVQDGERQAAECWNATCRLMVACRKRSPLCSGARTI